MSFSPGYLEPVQLLIQLLPLLNQQNCFALKGGTAINMFIRDMPRLSVDIDLTYLPKVKNIHNMTAEKHQEAIDKLKRVLEL